jgi:hypothetical protein
LRDRFVIASWKLIKHGRVVGLCFAAVCVAATFVLLAEPAMAQPKAQPVGDAAAQVAKEGWSFDDIKDVCEAIQFVMFSLGTGCALYWYFFQHIPSTKLPRIEFDVEIERAGENDAAWLVDVVALVTNLGKAPAALSELCCVLESVPPDGSSLPNGSFAKKLALSRLFEESWDPAAFVVDAGTRRRRALAVAIPKAINSVVVSATVRHEKRVEPYRASRFVRLGGGRR